MSDLIAAAEPNRWAAICQKWSDMSVHICSFSGSVAYLKPRQKRNDILVLGAIANDPAVSTWDMEEHGLWKTIYSLVERDLLVDETSKVSYPWHRFVVTEKGRAFLEAAQYQIQPTEEHGGK